MIVGASRGRAMSCLRTPTLESAAPRFANVEIALRKKLAPEDSMDLADALASRGLMFRKRQEYKPATDDYLAALSLFAAARRDNNAIDSVDGAFSLGDGRSGANGALAPPDSQSGAEDFVASVDEPYVPITIITAVDANADQAIGAGDAVAAKSLIDLMGQAEAQSARINQFMLANWPCHIDLAQVHYWDAVIDGARLKYSKKFNPGGGGEQSKYFDEANAEFVSALAISLFSAGTQRRRSLERSSTIIKHSISGGTPYWAGRRGFAHHANDSERCLRWRHRPGRTRFMAQGSRLPAEIDVAGTPG